MKERLCFLGIGLYWAWLFVACLSAILIPASQAGSPYFLANELLSLIFYVLVFLLATIKARKILTYSTQKWPYVLPFLAAFGTALVIVAPYLFGETAFFIMIVGAILTGFGSGVLLVLWGCVFTTFESEKAPRQMVLAIVTTVVISLIIFVMPQILAQIVTVLLLPASCILCILNRQKSDSAQVVPIHKEQGAPYPWKLGLGLASTGFAFGIQFGLTLADQQNGTEVSLLCLLVYACIGVAVLIYTLVTKRNIGFSIAYMAILPLLGAGFLVLTAFGTPFLLLSFFLVRAGYSLFDILVWLQLPKVYQLIHSMKGFTISRLCLDGGLVLGILLYHGFLAQHPTFLNYVLLGAAVLFLFALTISLNENPTHAWNLLPVPSRGHRYKQACEIIKEREGLTNRELDVLMLLARGRSGSYIEEKLFISQNTFQTHSRNIYRKLDIHSKKELMEMIDEVINR